MKRRIFLWLLALLIFISTLMGAAYTAMAAGIGDTEVTDSIYLDDNGNFVFMSYDKKATSTTRYKTVGFTISRCVSNKKEEYVPDEYIKVPLSTSNTPQEIVSETPTHICSKWTINADFVMSQIQSMYPDWYDALQQEKGYFLKFDAIMVIIRNGSPSGMIGANGTYFGTVYDKHSKEALKNAENWADPDKLDTHFDKYFFVGEMVEDDLTGSTDAPADEFVETIGKNDPYYRTYNEAATGEFDLSLGIPTSEDVHNGFEVDGWFGTLDVGKHEAEKTYTFTFSITYDVPYVGGVTQTTEDYTYTVTRKAAYFYIQNMALYDFGDAFIENSVYPGDTIVYTGEPDTVTFDVSVNGVTNPETVDTWVPDDSKHITWPEAGTYTSAISASTYEDGKSAAKSAAEAAVGKATVVNDRICINGIVYMDNTPAAGDEPLTYSLIGEDDYAVEYFDETVTIPSNVANGVYPTEMQVRFARMEPKTLASKIFTELHIKEGYENNEPIHVHTPVISPVTIIDPDTGNRYQGEHTQLIEENRVNVDYELLLDGTYTFKFDPELHREIQGYGWSGDPSKYDKYTAFKEVMFPFDVEVNGQYFNKDEWITLPDFQQNTFYITPWTVEKPIYTIKYRVAPENVVDENGINHIDDTEWLANTDMAQYVATYEITVEVSGRMYGFQAVGVNDSDMFDGYDGSHASGAKIPFCPDEQEKKAGIKNRIGENDVRVTKDGSINNAWDEANTLPFANGVSNVYEDMGTLYAGTEFSFTFMTMANLQDESGDSITVTPTFRYVEENGTVHEYEDIDVYYNSDAGTYIKAGSSRDRANIHEVSLSNEEFKEAYTREQLKTTVDFHNELTGDVLTDKQYLKRSYEASCFSRISLKNPLRLLAGGYEELERNLSNPMDSLEIIGTPEDPIDGDHEKLLKASIQKWYGTYYVPGELFVHLKEAGEGDDPAWEYAQTHDGLSSDSDFWEKGGYLVINFEIASKNNGVEHLEYFPSELEINEGRISEGDKDQWYIENFGVPDDPANLQSRTVKAGYTDTEIEVRSGDVAVVFLDESLNDRYETGILIIN